MEEWRDVHEFEGIYQVSSLGNIRNSKNKLLKLYHNTNGYMSIDLYKNGKVHKFRVHRLVAEAFIPNLYNLPMVNHRDGNKMNNQVSNLEWCDNSYNLSYGSRAEKMFQSRIDRNRKTAQKKVIQFDLQGNIISEYKSISEASRATGISCGAIWQSCNKGCVTNELYKWNYKL